MREKGMGGREAGRKVWLQGVFLILIFFFLANSNFPNKTTQDIFALRTFIYLNALIHYKTLRNRISSCQ